MEETPERSCIIEYIEPASCDVSLQLVLLSPANQVIYTIYTYHIIFDFINKIHGYLQNKNKH